MTVALSLSMVPQATAHNRGLNAPLSSPSTFSVKVTFPIPRPFSTSTNLDGCSWPAFLCLFLGRTGSADVLS
ncbi:hypothetical protein FKP32DRAFT_1587794 [Trametes sanguinea]|nr:hypothetical protein FKP32DRAFT_1587794 [Trametes sanguinea]